MEVVASNTQLLWPYMLQLDLVWAIKDIFCGCVCIPWVPTSLQVGFVRSTDRTPQHLPLQSSIYSFGSLRPDRAALHVCLWGSHSHVGFPFTCGAAIQNRHNRLSGTCSPLAAFSVAVLQQMHAFVKSSSPSHA